MHRCYSRFFIPIRSEIKLINSAQCVFQRYSKIHVCTVYRYPQSTVKWIHQVTSSANISLICNTISKSDYNICRYFSQGTSRANVRSKENHISTTNDSLSHSSMPTEVALDSPVDNSLDKQVNNSSNLFEDIDYEEITGGDEEKINKLKLLMLELDVMRQDGMPVPSKMSTEQWKELFELSSRNQKRKFLRYLFVIEMRKLSDVRKKEMKRIAKDQSTNENQETPSDHLKYGFQGSTIFVRIYDTTMNAHDNNKLIQAMRFGQDLIIDCGFYNDMNPMENKLCSKQLIYVFAENRIAKSPFNIHFCNLKKDSCLYHYMKKNIPTIEDPAFPINIHEDHYLSLFPKEKLVYLTPHCRTELKEFNSDDVYIIGAIVDRVNQNPLTLAKAKSEGLRMAQLPLDRYLHWAVGNKSLTVNQVVSIMQDLHTTGNWDVALKHVPRRKIIQPDAPIRNIRNKRKPPVRFNNYY